MDQAPRQSDSAPRPRRRRRRRRPEGGPSKDATRESKPQAPAAALAQTHDIRSQPTVVPLSSVEIAELKGHLAFLRNHRKLLKLRLNAQEDLLLNGAREPNDRGVCQHLLAKVEMSRVAAVVERLDPGASTSLLGGIVRFAHDIGYLLLYLESVRRSSSQAEAAATLAFGLKQIDFATLSAAQLRRVLDLVVEVFDPATRPAILLSLLGSKSFRQALEASLDTLPEGLAGYVSPLLAVQAAALRGAENPHGSEALRRGLGLMLEGAAKTLGKQPLEVRERLLRLGLALFDVRDREFEPGLDALLSSLQGEPALYRELGLVRAGRYLAAGLDQQAARLLTDLSRHFPDFAVARRWLEALEAPRLGRVALVGKSGGRHGDRRPRRFRPGFDLDRQTAVLVALAEADETATYRELAALWQELMLPGVAPLLEVGQTEQGQAYLVVPQYGTSLAKRLGDSAELAPSAALAISSEICVILAALARLGIGLPDGSPARYSLDDSGRVWLVDLVGARATDPPLAARSHLDHAKSLVGQIRRRSKGWTVSSSVHHALGHAEQVGDLGRALVGQRR